MSNPTGSLLTSGKKKSKKKKSYRKKVSTESSQATRQQQHHHEVKMEKKEQEQKHSKKTPPTAVFEWKDTETDAVGWVVLDQVINGIAGGGIFMHANATQTEVADIARNMTYKFTVTNPQIGGAKAGIRFDHKHPKSSGVIKRFMLYNKTLLQNLWVTAADYNTQDSMIEAYMQEMGFTTCQATLGRKISESGLEDGQEKKDLSGQLASLIAFPATPFFPLIEGTVGYGLAESIRTMDAIQELSNQVNMTSKKILAQLNRLSPKSLFVQKTDKLPRVLIVGFGAVGSSLAYYLQQNRIATVVGICDKDGFLVDSKGIDISNLMEIREERKKKLQEASASEQEIVECSKNFLCNLSLEKETLSQLRDKGIYLKQKEEDNQDFLMHFLRVGGEAGANVFCPCAIRYSVTMEVAQLMHKQGITMMLSGANNPFGISRGASEDVDGQVMTFLKEQKICVVPDWIVNSGTAQLFHRGLSREFDLSSSDVAQQVLENCAIPIRSFILTALDKLVCGRDPFEWKFLLHNLVDTCFQLAKERIQHPIPFNVSLKQDVASSMEAHEDPDTYLKDVEVDQDDVKSLQIPRFDYALPPLPLEKQLSLEERFKLIMSVAQEGECISPEELKELLRQNIAPSAYDGFEPSGRMHVAQGLMRTDNTNKFTKAGFTFIFWVADVFAQLNLKQGGDMTKIRLLGKYFIEVWKAAGMDTSRVRFLWASNEIHSRFKEYDEMRMRIAMSETAERLKKCSTIMGRKDEKSLRGSQIIYPVMQCTDIFFLNVDVCQLGNDQRKVNMLAREVSDTFRNHQQVWQKEKIKSLDSTSFTSSTSTTLSTSSVSSTFPHVMRNLKKPIIIGHTMLPGLLKNQEKMSKSDPRSAIFMEDDEDTVRNKISSAFCPEKQIENNPCLVWLDYLIFRWLQDNGQKFILKRDEKNGGDKEYETFDQFTLDYKEGSIHPIDLKHNLARYLNIRMDPVRKHFETDPIAKSLLDQVRRL